ncbi:hypothetical protein CLV62_12536 [Dysgonomonas alginatilytica]|uniref:Uncharacterized protein n=1 Tax=Dysgonomonas alginatilytica TaxID=1605892 RepID=A0A2V3PMH9_9BACT|nr:hypothetical protein [Dysgonomonas alginatilytica]PXV61203.1 hypothetical protein CLV62_12536 [Dysgonomonas alginatilytica]
MNYIREINSFYDWLETNPVSKSVIALWNALMHINNKTNWTQSFEVAISTLEFKTGFKRSELCEARNVLAQKGRITWKSRGGNLSAVYNIIPFSVHNTDAIADTSADTSADANPTQVRTQKDTQNRLLYKLNINETKEEDIKIEFDNFRKLYPGTKRGLDTEFENLKKKHKDYKEVLSFLLPALENMIDWRDQKKALNQFVPDYPNLQTWINQRRWETELGKIEKGGNDGDKGSRFCGVES